MAQKLLFVTVVGPKLISNLLAAENSLNLMAKVATSFDCSRPRKEDRLMNKKIAELTFH